MLGDRSPRALKQSYGLMVNYLYKHDDIEKNHEAFAARNEVAAASQIRKLVPTERPGRSLLTLAAGGAAEDQKDKKNKEFSA